MQFDQTDLNETVDAIRTRLSEGGSVVGLLEELVALVRDRETWWQTQLDSLLAAQEESTQERVDIMKGITHVIKVQRTHQHDMQALSKSLRRLQAPALAKSREITTTAIHPKAAIGAAQGLSLEAEARRGQLAKAALQLFGPNGGKSLKYEKNLASRLLTEGKLTQHQHHIWKQTGRVPDGVAVS